MNQRDKSFAMLSVLCATIALGGCAHRQHPQQPLKPVRAISPAIRRVLPQLEKGHADKLKLCWYAFWLRHLSPANMRFAKSMQHHEAKLQSMLKSWAKAHHVSLAFHYGKTVEDQAQHAVDRQQSKLVQADNNRQFNRDFLVLMETDFQWQAKLSSALLARVKQKRLRAYLSANAQYHAQGFLQLRRMINNSNLGSQ